MTDEEKSKAKEFIQKAKLAGYLGDVMFVCGALAFSKDNTGREIETLNKFITLIDEYENDDDFLDAAMRHCGILEE